jgi:hypothetical protein
MPLCFGLDHVRGGAGLQQQRHLVGEVIQNRSNELILGAQIPEHQSVVDP